MLDKQKLIEYLKKEFNFYCEKANRQEWYDSSGDVAEEVDEIILKIESGAFDM